jgi:ATP-dependent DNA helicase RecQ
MEAVFAYAEHKRCRSQMLLSYFNEPNAIKCGVCDVCMEERHKKKCR